MDEKQRQELEEIDFYIELANDAKKLAGTNFLNKLDEIKRDCEESMILSNRALIEQHIKRNNLLGKKIYVAVVQYANEEGEVVNASGIWLHPTEPQLGNKAITYNNAFCGTGMSTGTIINIHEVSEEAVEKCKFISMPHSSDNFWENRYPTK